MDSDRRAIPAEDDQGKRVVDRRDREIGIVAAVEGDTVYVDPDPSLTDKVKTALGWDAAAEEDLPVSPEHIREIDEDVVLDVERDEEFQEHAS